MIAALEESATLLKRFAQLLLKSALRTKTVIQVEVKLAILLWVLVQNPSLVLLIEIVTVMKNVDLLKHAAKYQAVALIAPIVEVIKFAVQTNV